MDYGKGPNKIQNNLKQLVNERVYYPELPLYVKTNRIVRLVTCNNNNKKN